MTVTEPVQLDVQSAATALNKVTNNLKIASLGLRALYVKKLPSDPQFKEVITTATTSALVMKAKFIPVSQNVLEKVKDFFENYVLQVGEFHDCIEDINKDAYSLSKQVDFVASMQQALSAELEKVDADIQILLERYEKEGKELEEKMKEQGSGLWSTIRSLTGFLQFIPEVGPLVTPIVEPLLDGLSDVSSSKKEHDIELTERQLEYAIISSLKDTVVKLLKESNESFQSVTTLLYQIEQVVAQLKKTNDLKVTEEHVNKISQDARTLIKEINKFILAVPTVVSNLDAIDKNFSNEVKEDANKWMENNESGINFLQVGLKVFTDPKILQTIMSVIAFI